MIHDFRVGEMALPASATVVVGSGAAGLALALALADAGETVIVIESGGDHGDGDAERAAASLNEAAQTGLPLDGVVNGRARTLGGSTALWHGQCMRLHPIDLEARPWVEHSGWPIAAAELDAHYPAAERFLQVSGRGYGSERWRDHERLPPLAWDAERLLHDFTEYTPRPHLGQVHRGRFASDAKLHLVLNATAARVIVDGGGGGDGGIARGVEVRAVGRPAATIAARRVVLACGGIENARLLMLSDDAGVGLGDGRRHTGRYYQDHPIIRTAQIAGADHRVLQDRYIALHAHGRRLFAKVRLAPDAQRRHRLLDATAVFVHDHDDPARAALRRLVVAARHGRRPEQPLRDAVRGLAAPWPLLRDLYRRYAQGLATGSAPSAVWLQLWVEQQPDADSRVDLDDDHLDALGLRRARLHWTCSDLELETSRAMTRWLAADLERLGVARTRFLPAMSDDAAWRGSVGDAAHPAGTTRMSADATTGVVDRDCAVHGVGGLHVAGSSVFPTCGYANPTLTIVALALRLAGHLAGDRGVPRMSRTLTPATTPTRG